MDKTSKILSKKEMKQDEMREEKATTMREREQCEKKMKRRTRQYEMSLRAGCDVRGLCWRWREFLSEIKPTEMLLKHYSWSLLRLDRDSWQPITLRKLNFHLPTSCEENASKHRSGKIIWVDPK